MPRIWHRLSLPSWLAALAFAPLLASCGGGGGDGLGGNGLGGNGDPASTGPCILAQQIDFRLGSVPAGFNSGTGVAVLDNSCTDPITNASVTVNGVALSYNATNQDYEGSVVTAPGGAINLKVIVNGTTYTASGMQFASFPVISVPSPAATWATLLVNALAWSGGTPTANALYAVGVLDASNPNGALVWPTSPLLFSIGTTNFNILPGSLTAGSRVAIVGIVNNFDIPGAADGSGLVVAGFDSVPITVVDGSSTVTLQSIAATPANPGIGKGTNQQFTATGTYSDGNHFILNGQPGLTWASSDTSKATINAFGLAIGADVGSSTISATLGSVSGSTQITVFPLQSIAVTPVDQAIETGASQQFTAIGTFTNNSTADLTAQVVWASSVPGKATISAAGFASGVSAGLSTITATLGNIAGSTTMSVVPGFLAPVKSPGPFTNPFNFFLGDTAIGDLNGDGRNDVAVIESNQLVVPTRVLVYYRNSQGSFAAPPQLITPDIVPKAVAIADVNNDGLADLIVAGNSTTATSGFIGRVAVYLQDGASHTLGASQELIVSTNDVGSLAVADLNGDSLLDIITAGTGGGANGVISMFLQGPAGALGAEVTYNNVPVAVSDTRGELHVADMNNDGIKDIVVQSNDKEFAVIKQGPVGSFSGTPDFYTGQTNGWPFFSSFALGDLNGDGLIDLAAGELNGNLNIFYQNAGGTLDGPAILPGNQANEVRIADIDGDGLNDVVIYASGTEVLVLYQVDHSLSKARLYRLPTQFSGGATTHQSLSVGELTGDGRVDIVAPSFSEGIFLLQGAP